MPDPADPQVPPAASAPGGTAEPPVPPPGEEEESSFAADMGRLFFVPALIVGLSVLIFLLFGLIASERRGAQDYIQEVRHGVTGRKWQAAFELSRVLSTDEEARRDPQVAREIAATLQDPGTTDPRVRMYLVVALQQIGDPATTGAVRAALSDADPEVRLFAARALGQLRDSAAVPALTEMLAGEDAGMRKVALHALGRIGDKAAVGPMKARLDDPVEDVRWNAALGLAALGDGSGAAIIGRMLDPAYLDGVEGISEQQKIEARLNAIQGAFLIGGPEMREAVERSGRADESLKVRDAALRALEQWR